jgi:hypothetical protein
VAQIKCVVEECMYNDSMKCRANGIEVRSSGDKSVMSADGTACSTFKEGTQR